jgi:hypothetical protein
MPITLECSCGKKLSVDEKFRGKKAVCPACGAKVLVEDTDATAVQEGKPRPTSTPAPEPRIPTKRPQAASRGILPWLAVGGCGVMLLLCCGVTGSGGWLIRARIVEEELVAKIEADKRAAAARRRDEQSESTNNLKQLGIAMHSFHDVYKGFPLATIPHPQTGQPLLSWRVTLLPYIEQEQLGKQIKIDEPWDSAHNRQFWDKMPKAYQLPGKPNDGKTYYQVFRGQESMFPDPAQPGPPFINRGLNLLRITDGASNTIMIVEAADAVNWMKPEDIPFQPGPQGMPLNRLGNHWGDDSFQMLLADGAVIRLRRTIPPAELQKLITRAGNEVVNFDRWEVR